MLPLHCFSVYFTEVGPVNHLICRCFYHTLHWKSCCHACCVLTIAIGSNYSLGCVGHMLLAPYAIPHVPFTKLPECATSGAWQDWHACSTCRMLN
jgi:hypothetical protein